MCRVTKSIRIRNDNEELQRFLKIDDNNNVKIERSFKALPGLGEALLNFSKERL